MNRLATLAFALLCVVPTLFAEPALKYPDHPVRLVVPYSAGGGIDTIARSMAERMRVETDQSWVVDNKTGASGLIAIQSVLGSPNDGHTLLVAPVGAILIGPKVMSTPLNPIASLAPVCVFAETTGFLFVGASLPDIKTFQAFVDYAKANPGKLTYASGGIGTQVHLSSEMIQKRLGIQLRHVPYRGAADAFNDLATGRIDVMWDPSALTLVRSGKARILAYMGKQRSPDFPDVPAFGEFSDLSVPEAWFGLFATQKTPQAVLNKADALCRTASTDKDVATRMGRMNIHPAYQGRKAFAQRIEHDDAVFSAVIKDLGLK